MSKQFYNSGSQRQALCSAMEKLISRARQMLHPKPNDVNQQQWDLICEASKLLHCAENKLAQARKMEPPTER